jgi:hypothetical protein
MNYTLLQAYQGKLKIQAEILYTLKKLILPDLR